MRIAVVPAPPPISPPPPGGVMTGTNGPVVGVSLPLLQPVSITMPKSVRINARARGFLKPVVRVVVLIMKIFLSHRFLVDTRVCITSLRGRQHRGYALTGMSKPVSNALIRNWYSTGRRLLRLGAECLDDRRIAFQSRALHQVDTVGHGGEHCIQTFADGLGLAR